MQQCTLYNSTLHHQTNESNKSLKKQSGREQEMSISQVVLHKAQLMVTSKDHQHYIPETSRTKALIVVTEFQLEMELFAAIESLMRKVLRTAYYHMGD